MEHIDYKYTILLFGHNHPEVFRFLYDLEIGDEIIINHGLNELYHVSEIKIIPVTDKRYLELNEEHQIRLFTCTRNSQERFMVVAK